MPNLQTMGWKQYIKQWIQKIPIAFTKNQQYDKRTLAVLKKHTQRNSICVDVGSHQGTILAMMIKACPDAMHYAFEPIPALYKLVKRKYGSAAKVFPYALSDKRGTIDFNYCTNHPAYSGIQKRQVPADTVTETITVESEILDNIIPATTAVALIKLDIEGGEYHALLGAEQLIRQQKPLLLFEFGKGSAECYAVTPQMMFDLLTSWGYQIFTLQNWLHTKSDLSFDAFENHFNSGTEYFFVAAAQQ